MIYSILAYTQRFPVLLLVLCLASSINAFFPTNSRSKWPIGPGVSHEAQTIEAFNSLAKLYFPSIVSPTASMIKARETIVKANAEVDDDQIHSAKHFDGENFDGGQARLVELKRNITLALRRGDAHEARVALGGALHTVQDFYSHTNWVELGNTEINVLLGKSDGIIEHAAFNERTCNGCIAASGLVRCGDCANNTDGFDKLTSGYYHGEDVPQDKNIPSWKCHHGGATDGHEGVAGAVWGSVKYSVTRNPPEGINKDSMNCLYSPHHGLHKMAADLATKASVQYIRDLIAEEGLTERELRLLCGAGTSLALAFNRASASARQQVLDIVSSSRLQAKVEPVQYIITPFGAKPLVLPDPNTVLQWLNETREERPGIPQNEQEGGVCEGLCLAQTIDQMLSPGHFFILSDTPVGASEDLPDSVDTAIQKNIAIDVLSYLDDLEAIADEQLDNPSNTDYEWDGVDVIKRGKVQKRSAFVTKQTLSALSAATGGSYEVVPNLGEDQQFPDVPLNRLKLNRYERLSDSRESILKVSGNLDRSRSFRVPVDSQMSSFTLSCHGANAEIRAFQPDGTLFDPVWSSATLTRIADTQYLTIDAPMPGSWKFTFVPASTDEPTAPFSASFSGVSPLKLSRFAFVEERGRPGHQGYYERQSSVLARSTVPAEALLSGDFSSAMFSLRDSLNRPIGRALQMKQGSGEFGESPKESFFGNMYVGAGESRVYVEGLDAAGMPFQRLWDNAVRPTIAQ